MADASEPEPYQVSYFLVIYWWAIGIMIETMSQQHAIFAVATGGNAMNIEEVFEWFVAISLHAGLRNRS